MANKDYTKFSKPQVHVEEEVKVEAVELEEVAELEETAHANELKTGEVANCTKLNVREHPYATADIVCVIKVGTELMIDEAESTNEFYKVCTASGVEGYCMKKFVTIV